MRTSAWRYTLYGQLALYGGLTLCVLIRPRGLTINSGVSYYGTFLNTIVPYCIALLGAAYFSWQAASYISDEHQRLAASLRVLAVLLVGIMLTPYTLNHAFNWLHTALGSMLFVIQLVMTARLSFWGRRNWVLVGLWLLELAGGVASAFYVAPAKGFLIESQILFQVAYGCLVLHFLQNAQRLQTNQSMHPITDST